MKSTVYLVQLDCAWEDKQANFQRVERLLEEEKPDADSLIVLPEMFATGFSLRTEITRQGPERETDEFLRRLAMRHRCTVLGGMVSAKASGRCHNEAAAFSPSGGELARYAKIQPFNLGGEGRAHEAGKEIVTFSWHGFTIAPLICYDLRFPELAREAVKNGAGFLIYIASWPVKRWHHWVALLQARSIENLCYTAGVNRCGSDPSFTYPGRSLMADPHGFVIADAGMSERVVRAVIDSETVESWRREFPALDDAGMSRKEITGIVNK